MMAEIVGKLALEKNLSQRPERHKEKKNLPQRSTTTEARGGPSRTPEAEKHRDHREEKNKCGVVERRITVGARRSPLSRVQVEEVLREIGRGISFAVKWVETRGDLELGVSLRGMEKSDFFTRELDLMVLEGKVRVAIHSAKDLPEPLREGLVVAALTKGVDGRDALVMKGELRKGALIATSSARREAAVRELERDVRFVDLRGTIHARLAKIDRGEVDGIVVAEAALIRLGLTHLKRIFLPGPTAEGQGRLAVVARADDREMIELFSQIHHV